MATLPAITPYQRTRVGWLTKAAALIGLTLLAMLTGFMVALAPPQLLIVPAIPIAVIAGCALWMLPDVDRVYRRTMAGLMGSYVLLQSIWPSYIAFNAPGLPWITPARLVVGSLLAVAVYTIASSRTMRAEIGETLAALPRLRTIFWCFFAVSVVTIPLSGNLVQTLTKWGNNQIFWTGSLVLGAWLARREGFVHNVARGLTWTAVVTALIGLWEWHKQSTPWLNHIPAFLKVDPEYLDHVLSSQARAGADVYRLHSTYATSLSYAEYLAITFPFVVYFCVNAKTPIRRTLLFAGCTMCALAMYWTNARSGVIGFFSTLFLSVLYGAYRRWRRNPGALLPAATLFAYPAAALVFVILVIAWPRLHVAVLGGGAQQASSEARGVQWSTGVRIIAKNPVGHGAGRSGEVLGYTNSGGELTIDTFYLSLLLDYGIVGFTLFMGLFVWASWVAFRMFVRAPPGEMALAGPISIGLLNFAVVKSVLSSEINIPIAFLMAGLVFGLAWREQHRSATLS